MIQVAVRRKIPHQTRVELKSLQCVGCKDGYCIYRMRKDKCAVSKIEVDYQEPNGRVGFNF